MLIYLLEPVSSTAPRIASLREHDLFIYRNLSISILCPAQGYPAPKFRYGSLFQTFRLLFLRFLIEFNPLSIEPVSSTAPRIPSVMSRPLNVPMNQELSLLCPAQGYPAPKFR